MEELKPGDIIGGYRIQSAIARGGMGTVFRAHHVELERVAAVKVLKQDLTAYPDIIQRFLREGKLIAKLDHPGIIKIYDLGKDGERYYLVMELIDGLDLQKIIREEGPMRPSRVLHIARQVAEALDYAHASGVVHRDIKPSNIMLAADGSVRLTDFGIARLVEQETQITSPGALLGTPIYMSPEQCRGSSVDGRSDLYSLGATLYILLSGKPPFSGKVPATLVNQIIHQNPPPLESLVPDLKPSVVNLVKRLMAKYPAARYQTGKELISGIDQILRNRDVPKRHQRAIDPEESSIPRGPVIALVAMLALVVVGLYLAWPAIRESLLRAVDPGMASAHIPDHPPVVGPPASVPDSTDSDPGREEIELTREELEARLLERLETFQVTLLGGQEAELVNFIEPRYRRSPMLLLSIGRIVQQVSALGADVSVERSFTLDERKADVIFLFRPAGSRQYLKLPVSWVNLEGSWYLHPAARR